MAGGDVAARIEAQVVAVNVLLRKKGGAGLEVRVLRDGERVWVRTDLMERDGTRRMRQESSQLTPEKALAYLRDMETALRRA